MEGGGDALRIIDGRGVAADGGRGIAIDRAWIGAASGWVGNPTVWLFLAWTAAFAVGTIGYLHGTISAWVVVPLHAFAAYVAFTVLHEGMHGIAHADRAVNAGLARVSGMILTIPIPLFRAVHLEHHSHTNDPARDPDFVVARTPRALLPLWCVAVVAEYRRAFYGRGLWRTRRDLAEAIVTDVVAGGLVLAAVAGGWWRPLLVLWLAPAAIAVLVLAFFFDFVPHHPHTDRRRHHDTSISPGAVKNVLLLGQNHHLIHHLWTTIPWYRYQAVFRAVRPELAARGSRIGGADRDATPRVLSEAS